MNFLAITCIPEDKTRFVKEKIPDIFIHTKTHRYHFFYLQYHSQTKVYKPCIYCKTFVQNFRQTKDKLKNIVNERDI